MKHIKIEYCSNSKLQINSICSIRIRSRTWDIFENQLKYISYIFLISFKVLEQRFQKLQAERNDLHSNFVSSVQEVVQKANFKKLLLERKVVALADSLEKKDAQLNEILAASNLEPAALSVVTRKLEDVLDAKNGAIKDLQVRFLVIEVGCLSSTLNSTFKNYQYKLKIIPPKNVD